MIRKFIVVALGAVLLLMPVVSASGQGGETVFDVVAGNAQLNTFESALTAAGLQDLISGAGPFTVFAPTDAAFRALPVDLLESLNADPTGALGDLVRRHIVAGEVSEDNLATETSLVSQLGEALQVGTTSRGIVINGSADVIRVVSAANGMVYIVDAVLLPVDAAPETEVEPETEAAPQVAVPVTTTTTTASTTTAASTASSPPAPPTTVSAYGLVLIPGRADGQVVELTFDQPVAETVEFMAPAAPVHQTGLNMVVTVVNEAPFYINPMTHGDQVWPPGVGLLLCQDATITETYGEFGKVELPPGGWIPLTSTLPGPNACG